MRDSWHKRNIILDAYGQAKGAEMAKVFDKNGKEIEGQKVVTEGQANHFAEFTAKRSLQARRERALKRQEARTTRSPYEQVALLHHRPGQSFKERTRLMSIR